MMKLKQLSTTALALLLALAMTACGGAEEETSAPAVDSTPSTSDEVAAEEEYEEEYEDEEEYEEEGDDEGASAGGFNVSYDAVEPWVAMGSIGFSTAQELLFWAMNEDMTFGMLSFVAASNPETPFCVLGEMGVAENEEGNLVGYMVDETTGVEMAFVVEKYDETSVLISGVFPSGLAFEAICNDATRDEILPYVQDLCENYTFVG